MAYTKFLIALLFLGTVCICTGCSDLRARYEPEKEITATTVHNVRHVYVGKLAEYSVFDFLLAVLVTPDWSNPLGHVAVNGSEHLLYYYKNVPTGFRSIGAYRIDLRSGSDKRLLQGPWERGELDYVARVGWPTSMPTTKPGQDIIHLTGEVASGKDMISVESAALTCEGVRFHEQQASDFGQLFAVGEKFDRVRVVGGAGDFVLSTRSEKGTSELLVARATGGRLDIVSRQILEPSWNVTCSAIDWKEMLWFVGEVWPSYIRNRREKVRLRAYEIPSLQVRYELPASKFPQERIVCSSRASLLALIPAKDLKHLVLFDTRTGTEIAQIGLNKVATDDWGWWQPFIDPYGYYVGVYGSHWVQLFAVSSQPYAR